MTSEPEMSDDEQPPSPEELAGAEALRLALETDRPVLSGDDAVALIAAASGAARPLDELSVRRIVRDALADSEPQPRKLRARPARLWHVGALTVAAVAALIVLAVALPGTSRRSLMRPSGLVVPGPFPPTQTASQRLDRITLDRMAGFRDSSLYGALR